MTHKTNVMGTLNMLGLAKRVGARFLLTSTSEVYGDPLQHPQKESYWGHVNPIGVLILSQGRNNYHKQDIFLGLHCVTCRYSIMCRC
jgi:nucleoside-diphosphate-sugar epimerase